MGEPVYRRLGYRRGDFPNAETIGERTVTLPLFTQMREADTVIVLETNYGGHTRVVGISHRETVRSLMSCCEPVPGALAGLTREPNGA